VSAAGFRAVPAVACALGGVLFAVAAAAAPEVRTLDNGLRVAVFHDPRLPIVQVQLTVAAGSAAEVRGQSGAARLVAEMLRRGTTSRGAVEFAAAVDRLGATVTSTSGRDFASVSGSFLARDFADGMELLADAVLRPAFLDSVFQRARTAGMRAVGQQLLQPSQVSDEMAWGAAWKGAPYERPVLGRFEGLRMLALPSVREFYAAHWSPDRAVLAIAGDVTAEAAFAAAAEWFGAWVRRGAAAAPAAAPPPAARVVIFDRADVAQTELRLAVRGPRRGDPDETALALATKWLSDGPDARLRGDGLRLARAGQLALRDGGLLWLAAAAAHDSAASAARRLRDEMERLAASPPEEPDLAALRPAFVEAFRLSLETLGGVVGSWSANALHRLPEEDVDALAARVAAVGPERVAEAARRWCDPDRAVLVAVGPAAVLRGPLAEFGPVEVVGVAQLAGNAAEEVKPLPEFTPAQEASGRELIRRMLAAHGGLARLRGIRDSAFEADATVVVGGRDLTGRIEQVRKEPYRMRFVTTLAGVTTRQVLDGDGGWIAGGEEGGEAHALDSLEVRDLRGGFEADVPHVLVAAADPAARLGALGRDWTGGHEVEKVEIRPAQGPRRLLHLDVRTARLVAVDQSEGPGDEFRARRVYGDYRRVKGLWLPFEEERLLDGRRVMMLRLKKLEWNAGVADAVFRKPERPLPPPSR
jgi:zinc protease